MYLHTFLALILELAIELVPALKDKVHFTSKRTV